MKTSNKIGLMLAGAGTFLVIQGLVFVITGFTIFY